MNGDMWPEFEDVERQEMFRRDRARAVRNARLLLDANPLILDTETTGLGRRAQICEIALINSDGGVVLDARVKPTVSIPEEATAIHGIGDEDVADAPTLNEVLTEDILDRICDAKVGIYNAAYDIRMLRQSMLALKTPARVRGRMEVMYRSVGCIMKAYAAFIGNWSEYDRNYGFVNLDVARRQCGLEWNGEAHSALADTRMALGVLKHMASSKEVEDIQEEA